MEMQNNVTQQELQRDGVLEKQLDLCESAADFIIPLSFLTLFHSSTENASCFIFLSFLLDEFSFIKLKSIFKSIKEKLWGAAVECGVYYILQWIWG